MASVNYKKLIAVTEARYQEAVKEGKRGQDAAEESTRDLKQLFEVKAIRPSDFDLGRLFCECFSWNDFNWCRSGHGLANQVFEAAGAVSTRSFLNISGQIAYSAVMEAFSSEEYVFSQLIPAKQTPYNGEKIPGISRVGNEALVVPEGEPFPIAGVVEDWIETAEPQKRGLVVPVTREAVFFDRTGLLLDRCVAVGEDLGISKENRLIDAVIDENAGASSALTGHRYRWRGTSIATYNNNTGSHSWDNLAASNALVDYTDIDAAEQLMNDIQDPNTAEPITGELTHLVVTKSLEATARHIMDSEKLELARPGFATSGDPNVMHTANRWRNKYVVVSTRRIATRLATDTSWFLCNPARAWAYMHNWPLQVKQLAANSHMEFEKDIVAAYRADERGNPTTLEPRYSIKSTA